VQAFLVEGLKQSRPLLDDLNDLEKPEDRKPDAEAALDLAEQRIELAEMTLDRLRGGADPQATLTEIVPALTELRDKENAFWLRLGVKACVSY
jgi:hypothetical protein